MSVTTTVDEKLRDINDKIFDIRKCIRENLKEIRILTLETFDPDTWGSGDFKDGLEEEYHEVANELQNVLKKLDRF